jgi:hypothetical protein
MEWQILVFTLFEMTLFWVINNGLLLWLKADRPDLLRDLVVQIPIPFVLFPFASVAIAFVPGPFWRGVSLFTYVIVSAALMQVLRMARVKREYFSVTALLWFAMFGFVGGGLLWLDGFSFIRGCLSGAEAIPQVDLRVAAAVECKSDASFFLQRIFDGMTIVVPTLGALLVIIYVAPQFAVQWDIKPVERPVLALISSVALVSVLGAVGIWAAAPAFDLMKEAERIIVQQP